MVSITGYVDPGVYIGEVQTPGSVNVTASRSLCLVGLAPRTKRSTDEVIIRGKIYEETLASWSASTPYTHVLANPCNRDRTNAILYKNDNAMGYGEWSFAAATLVGTEWGGATIDVSSGTGTAQYFTLSADGNPVVTIDMDAAVTAAGGAPAAATGANIADAINYELSNALGTYYSDYGTAYAAFATQAVGVANPIVTLTSPVTTSASDIKIFLSPESTNDGASEISNTGWAPSATAGVQADTYVVVIDGSYTASATYEIEYVSIDSLVDPLDEATATTPLDEIIRVGTYPGSSSYVLNTDYEKQTNYIDWHLTTSAEATVTATVAGPYNTATLDKLYMGLDGGPVLTITLTSGGATTAATLASDINTAFAASSNYGPEYGHTAEDSAGTLKFTRKNAFEIYPASHGAASSIVFYTDADDAFSLFFGASVAQPYETVGVGNRPFFGATYYATYSYTRATTEYDLPVRVTDTSGLIAQTSPLTSTNYTGNDLAVAGLLAFENGAPNLWLQQINDSTAPGSPTSTQIRTAIDNCAEKSAITEIVVLNTSLDAATYLQAHISEQSSILEKKPRRGWYGMASGTDVGDPDTPDTLVYRATQTLQPGATSAGRGRQILCAPCDIDRVLTLEDGTEVTRALDGSYVAAAVAAYFTSLPGAADAMVRKTITGFDIDTFEEYTKGERHILADNGVLVVTLDAGNLRMLDPLTTEAGGGGVVHYEEPAASWQKDVVTATVNNLIDTNLVGVVPTDVADFLVDIKQWIMLGILANIENGTIGPYTDESGNIRDINPAADIQAWQSTSDSRTFYFRYWYNLRYPAKRFFGEYSVDNPFFSA
jgi:hypothetical protein